MIAHSINKHAIHNDLLNQKMYHDDDSIGLITVVREDACLRSLDTTIHEYFGTLGSIKEVR